MIMIHQTKLPTATHFALRPCHRRCSGLPLTIPINYHHRTTTSTGGRRSRFPRKCSAGVPPSLDDRAVVVDGRLPSSSSSITTVDSASDVVRKFYDRINRHHISAAEDLIAENCVYEDLVFPQPFVGRRAILQFFQKFTDSVSRDLQFVIDDISVEDSSAVGVTWHLEWKGRPFPFSKGCSFYRLAMVNGQRQIIYGRDSVEPAIKPGETALVCCRDQRYHLAAG